MSALLSVMCLSLPAKAVAQDLPPIQPQQALEFNSGLAETARAVNLALKEGDPWEQVDWTFTLRPSLLYRTYLDDPNSDLLNPRLSTTLQVRFGERPLDTIRRAIRLERALQAHDRADRLETRDALLAFGELVLAQAAYLVAAGALADLPAGSSELDQQSARLDLHSAEAALQEARTEARRFSMSGEAVFEAIRFQVPTEPATSELSHFRLQELAVAEAETRYLEAGGRNVLKDLRFGVGYRTDGIELDLEGGYMAGRPGLRLGTIQPGGRERLEFRVSAEFAVGQQLRDLPRLREDVELEQEELARLAADLRAGWLVALEDATLAEETLELEEASLQEAMVALDEARDALADRLAVPSDDETADERELTRLGTTVDRAEREVARLATRVQRAWITYVRRHHDLLEAAGAGWQVRQDQAGRP